MLFGYVEAADAGAAMRHFRSQREREREMQAEGEERGAGTRLSQLLTQAKHLNRF